MLATENIIEWLGAALFGAASLATLLVSLRLTQTSNKVRFYILLAALAGTAIGYGAMAFDDGDVTRKDGRTVVLLRYVLYAITHPLIACFLTLSLMPNYFCSLVAALLTLLLNGFLFAGARAVGDVIWLWFTCAAASWLLVSAWVMLFIRPRRDAEADSTERSELGDWSVLFVKIATVAGLGVYLAMFVLDKTWFSLLSRQNISIVYLLLDFAIKAVAGVILLWLFKPEKDEPNAPINMSFDTNNNILGTKGVQQSLPYSVAPVSQSSAPPPTFAVIGAL
jgi:bacteriorhodopsin